MSRLLFLGEHKNSPPNSGVAKHGGNFMGVEKMAEHRVREEPETAVEPARPDAALGLWVSWMERASAMPRTGSAPTSPGGR